MDNGRDSGRNRQSGPGGEAGKTRTGYAGSGRGRGSKGTRKPKMPIALSIAMDFIAAALLLGIFYVTNYMIKIEVTPAALPTTAATDSAATAGPTDTGTQATPEATIDPNDWRAKFAGKFTDGAVEQTGRSYRSANISITIEEVQKYDITCYVADVYVADLKYFRTAFAKKPDVMGCRELTDKVAAENGAILAINGDHCLDNEGPVIRNGQLYRETQSSMDILVMNYDGSMQTFSPDEIDMEKIKSEGAYQVWTFGPMLLKDGQPVTQFNITHTGAGINPRTAVGYFEPGHYCFVVVGGRVEGTDEGYTIEQLSQLMYELGCAEAYNLDGGRSTEMIFMGEMLNRQSPRRSTPDILYIGEE